MVINFSYCFASLVGNLNCALSLWLKVPLKMDYVLRILSGFNCVMGLSFLE